MSFMALQLIKVEIRRELGLVKPISTHSGIDTIRSKLLTDFRDRLLHNFPLQGSLLDEGTQNLRILSSDIQT